MHSYYAAPGPLTELTDPQASMARELPIDPVELCLAVQGLLVLPTAAFGDRLPDDRLAERNTRPASALLELAIARDASPLGNPRRTEDRIVGTCRHYAVLSTALLRAAGIPARARCGFATYFEAPRRVDHWVTEHWSADDGRWIRIDSEVLGSEVVERPEDLRPGAFLTAGEAWLRIRAGAEDPMEFGVSGTDNWGPGEVRGNLMRDLAALNKIEMLPWDEWGPMEQSYRNETGESFDLEMDEAAAVCAADDRAALTQLYLTLPVPEEQIG